jgi:ribonuclease BN (tRNA processing enzyme)
LNIVAKVSNAKQVVQVYGPVGLYDYIASSLSLTYCELRFVQIEVYEFQSPNANVRSGQGNTNNRSSVRGLIRKSIPRNEDGTWTISKAVEIETPEDAARYSSKPQGANVYAAKIPHVPKLECFGYVVREAENQPRKIDQERATALGVQPGKKYKLLKSGFNVMSDDEEREIQADDVLVGGRLKPRSLALLGDCSGISLPMLKLSQNVDVLVHEATFSEQDVGDKVNYGGHSTAAMAGRVANLVGAKTLLLNHLSPARFHATAEGAIVKEANQAIDGKTKVQLSYDFMELLVPYSGFEF